MIGEQQHNRWVERQARTALVDVQRAALADPLTGLFNRGFLESRIAQELARCRRQGAMASLVVVDLDDFGVANECFGRSICDAALLTVTEVIRRQLRAADVGGRFGGDEFALLLPDTYRSGALLVGERIVTEVRHQFASRPVAGCRLALTVSVGIASYSADCATCAPLLDAAARALYEAKLAGGDRVAPLL